MREQLIAALALKELPRSGWVRAGVAQPESVAAHSWGVAWLVLVLCPPELDRERALGIAILHDLAEARVGDLTPYDGVDAPTKAAMEHAAFQEMSEHLPRREELRGLIADYGRSPEGRFVKACDKLDMALQAARYGQLQPELDLEEFVDSALGRLEPGLLRELVSG